MTCSRCIYASPMKHPYSDGIIWCAQMADVASATHYTAARAAKIDNLDAAITTRPTLAQVEASTVLAKQAKLDFVEKWILNKLVESPSGTWTLYDTDDVSVLKVWTWTAATSTRSKAT